MTIPEIGVTMNQSSYQDWLDQVANNGAMSGRTAGVSFRTPASQNPVLYLAAIGLVVFAIARKGRR